jgi:hypothetical protein
VRFTRVSGQHSARKVDILLRTEWLSVGEHTLAATHARYSLSKCLSVQSGRPIARTHTRTHSHNKTNADKEREWVVRPTREPHSAVQERVV